MKGKACRKCNLILTGKPEDAPKCTEGKTHDFSTDYQGLLIIIDAKDSIIAKKLGITKEAWYALKVR